MHTRKLCLLLACMVLMLNESAAECSNTTEQSLTFDVNVSTSESGKVIQSPCSPTPFIAWPQSILWRINNHDGCGLALATLHRFRINFHSLELRLVWSPDYDGNTDHAVLSELHRNTGMTMSFENQAIVYVFLDSPIAWLAWFPLDTDSPAIEKIIEEYEYAGFQIMVNSVCENNVTCEDQPCGPGSSCTQLDQGYLCHCAPGYGGINCNDDSRIDQVFLVEKQTAIINSPGYRIKHIDSEQYVWRVTGKPGCGIGILTLDFELADGLLKLRTSPSKYSVMKSFQGNPRPYVYVDYSVIWLEFWSSDRAYVLPEQRGFSLELSIQCYNMSNDVCYRINPCGPRSDCSAFDGGYYCMCDTWYSGVNCLEEQRPVVVMVPDSVDEMVVISPGPIYPPATTFLWRIDADLDCNIGAYFAKLRINYNDVLTILLTPPSLRDIFYQFNQNDFAYFFVESSHLWLEFKSGLGLNRMAELSMLVQCRYDSEVTKCESQGPCYTGSLCTDNPFGYVCMCPPGYTGINCENDTYVTHLHLSEDEDRHLQYSRTDLLTTERNIWHVHGTPHCAVGVSTNRQDFGRITSLRFLRAFNIDTTFALYTRSNLDTWYMYIASSEIVIQIDFKMVFTKSAHFELDLESQCTPEVLSCEDSLCSEGSSCLDQDYGFICRCFPGFTETNCLQGNEVHHIDLEMDRPLVLDLPEYLGYMPPYPQMSWFVQGVEGYTIGVSVQPPSCPFCTSLTMNAEPTQSGFMVESAGSVFVLLNHSSIWLSCPEHTCTIYGAAVHEISIQPSQDLSPDPCQKAECSSSSECHTLDIGGYVCNCWPGFHGVQCKNDSGAHKVFVNSSESVAIPSLSLPMSTPADTTTYVQTIPGCGIGILRIMLQAWPIEYVLLVHSETASDLLRLDSVNSIYDQYHFINHHAIWMEIHSKLKAEFSFVNVTSQCNEGKTVSCMPNPCEHGSLCTSLQDDGYSCSCQVGFAGIRCTDELAVGHIEVNASTPGTLQLLAGEFVHPYQAWRVEVTEGCSIGIDFRHLRIKSGERFTIKDNLTAPTINQLYMKDLVKDMYINFPKHVVWFQYEEWRSDSTLHIVLYESCVRGNCSLGLCTTDSVCEDFYDGYSCDCMPGFGGVNCAEDVGVREWILNPSQELDLVLLEENITCKVEVPDQGCGMELFLNHSTVVVKGPMYLSLIVQSSVSKSTFLTASEGKFNEYAYFDLSTLWFQLYIPLELTLTSQVRISACCDSFLSELNCSSTPCSVHSDCIDHAAGYKCVCHPGYEGVNCSEVMEKAKGLIEYVHVNNTNMNVTVCVEHQACSNMGCGQQVDAIAASYGCSCDDACEHFGDCCFDYPSTCQNGVGGGNFRVGFGYGGFGISGVFDPFRSEEEEFDMPVSVHPDMFSCVPTVKWNYLFVSRCPPQWNSSHSRARCEGAADFSDPLTFIPVSLGTKVTFRNVYCAVCHGVHPSNLTSWPIDFHCGDDNQRSDLGVMWDRIRRGICNYTIDDSGFPGKPAYRPCSIDMINDCPNDFADSGITEACAEFHAPLKPLDKQSVFSNGYCLECNLPGYSYSPFLPCLDEKLAQNDRPVAGFPLTVLVDFKGNNGIQVKVDEAVVSGKKMECQEGAVFDSLAGICRSLSCTDGYTLHDGECTWSVMCGGNRVGIELSGFDVIDRECVSSQEMHYMIKCLADILELSLDDVSLVHENLEEHHCISHNMNDTISLEVHVKMTYSEIREIMADISSSDLCGALMLQFHVSCSDEEDMPCNNGWLSMDYGSYVSVSYTDQISQLTFRGIQATQRYQPSDIRRMVMIQGQQGNGSLSFLEMIQFCADMTENSTSPGLWDLPCPTITMNASEFRQLIIGNNTFMVHLKSGNQFSESEFTISDTGHILVCSFLLGNSGIVNLTSDWFLQYSDTQSILSTVCVSLSLLCLSVTLATHLIFPSLRKLTNNKLLMMLCVFLLVAQLLTVVGSYASPIPLLCKIISVITHFCWIAVFAITNSLAFDLHLTFGYNRSFSFAQTSFKSLVRYIVYIPGVALCVVIPCVCIDSLTDSTVLDYTYGDLCWVGDDFMRFLSFGVPMAVLLAINVILFSYTALGIWKGYQNAKKVGRQNLRPSFQERLDLLKIYIKVSTLMGFTWTTAFIIPFTGITALWYLFIVLNGLQGVYIFLAFTTTARVWNLFKAVVISEPPSLSRKSKGTESTLRSDMSSRSAVDQGKVDDDLTVDLSTIRRWKEEKVESLKKTGGSGL